MTGIVTEFKRFAVHDGEGIRTTVFLKGCPLRCIWCHNPESLTQTQQLSYLPEKCVGCGECAKVCPHSVHQVSAAGHLTTRSRCTCCGMCVDGCPTQALRVFGREMTVEDVLSVVCEDRMFYGTRGGMTLSGGEPTAQPAFAAALLKAAKSIGLNTALDTCGDAPQSVFANLAPYVDCFLYDIKHMDPERHRTLTGRTNARILANYRFLASKGYQIEVRIPLIPGCNDSADVLHATGEFLAEAPPRRVKLLPYHSYGRGKYDALALPYPGVSLVPPTAEQLSSAADCLRRHGLNVAVG